MLCARVCAHASDGKDCRSYLAPASRSPHRTPLLGAVRDVHRLLIQVAVLIRHVGASWLVVASNVADADAAVARGRARTPASGDPLVRVTAERLERLSIDFESEIPRSSRTCEPASELSRQAWSSLWSWSSWLSCSSLWLASMVARKVCNCKCFSLSVEFHCYVILNSGKSKQQITIHFSSKLSKKRQIDESG